MQTEANLISPFTLLCRELLGERSASRHLGDLWKSLLNWVQQRVGGPRRFPHSWPLAWDYISASSLVYIFSLDTSHFPLCALWLLLYTSQILSWTVSPLRARAGSFHLYHLPPWAKMEERMVSTSCASCHLEGKRVCGRQGYTLFFYFKVAHLQVSRWIG